MEKNRTISERQKKRKQEEREERVIKAKYSSQEHILKNFPNISSKIQNYCKHKNCKGSDTKSALVLRALDA